MTEPHEVDVERRRRERGELSLTFFGRPMIKSQHGRLPLSGIPGLVISLLAVAGGDGLTNAELVDRVWTTNRPPTADTSLRVHLTRARSGLASIGAQGMLVRHNGLLRLSPSDLDIDLRHFRASAHAVLRSPQLDEAKRVLDRWRGEPFQGIPANAVLDAERRGLLMIRATVACIYAEMLPLSSSGLYVEELDLLMREHPQNARLAQVLIDHLNAAGCHYEAEFVAAHLQIGEHSHH